MPDMILVTGATGTTGRRICNQLGASNLRHRAATRSPKTGKDISFDWTDDKTWAAALKDVGSLYLVAPTGIPEPLPVMTPFMKLAIRSGVQRFVLLSASSLEPGGPMMGKVHSWLRDQAPEWVVLRPSWFMQNFSNGQHLAPIRDEAAIYTATGKGRIGFIDAEDIAAVAVKALSQPEVASGDMILTGPAALSYDDVAQALSDVLDQSVKHHHLSVENLAARHVADGLPKIYADTLLAMDAHIAAGSEDRVTDTVPRSTGRPATKLADFIAAHADLWRSPQSGIP